MYLVKTFVETGPGYRGIKRRTRKEEEKRENQEE